MIHNWTLTGDEVQSTTLHAAVISTRWSAG
jgi:hypothetical protein